jgi:hypothetical protein
LQSIVDGYKEPLFPPTNDNGRKLGLNNSKSKNALMNSLSGLVYVKFMHCISAKDICDKLQNVYEGDAKFKERKLQTYIGQFEQLKMKDDENIEAYFLQVDDVGNLVVIDVNLDK